MELLVISEIVFINTVKKTFPGFTNKYNICKLLYFEEFTSVNDALNREKRLKNLRRKWKFNLIKSKNPELEDLDPETSSG